MDLESKIMGFQFEPERSTSSHEGLHQDSSDEGNTTERDVTLVFGECEETASQ